MIMEMGAALISGYQRWISPYKGFHCAQWLVEGGQSCSEYVRRLLTGSGMRNFWAKVRARFQQCKASAELLRLRRTSEPSRSSSTSFMSGVCGDEAICCYCLEFLALFPWDVLFWLPCSGL